MNEIVSVGQPLAEDWREPTALERKADEINAALDEVYRAERREDKAWTGAMNARVALGLLLIEARDLLEREDPQTAFSTWVEANVRRSREDCYACIRLAESHDRLGPCTAPLIQQQIWDRRAEEERKRWRDAKAKSRAATAGASQDVSGDGHDREVTHQTKRVQSALGAYRNMTVEERLEFFRDLTPEQRLEAKTIIEEIDHGAA